MNGQQFQDDDQMKHLVELFRRASEKKNVGGQTAVVNAAEAIARAASQTEGARRLAIFADAV